jgi:hypothetical protein
MLLLLGGAAVVAVAASSSDEPEEREILRRHKALTLRGKIPDLVVSPQAAAATVALPKNKAVIQGLISTFSGGNPNDYPAPYSWAHTQDVVKFVLDASSRVMPGPGDPPEKGQKVRDRYLAARDRYIRIQQSSMTNADKVLATIWHVVIFCLSRNTFWWWYHGDDGPTLAKNQQLGAVANWVGAFFVGPETATAPLLMKSPTAPWTAAIPNVKGLDGNGPVYMAGNVMRTGDIHIQRRLLTAVMRVVGSFYPDHAAWMDRAAADLEKFVGYDLSPDERTVAGNLKAIEQIISVSIVIMAEYIEAPDVAAMEESFAWSIFSAVVMVAMAVAAPYVAAAVAAVAQAAKTVGGAATAVAALAQAAGVSTGTIAATAASIGAVQAAVGAGVTALLGETHITAWPTEFAKVEEGVQLAQEAAGYTE